MPRQKQSGEREFDWTRAAQLDALNRMNLPDRLVGLGAPVRKMTAISVLRVIDDFQRQNASAWPHLPTIARHARCSKKTVERVIDCMERLGVLTVWEERRDRAPLLKMAINWDRVFAERLPAMTPPDNLRRRKRRRQNDSGSRQNDSGSRQNDSGSGALCKKRIETDLETSPPSPPRSQRPRDRWEEAEERLGSLGVSAFETAASEARRHVDAEHVLALCDWFAEHRLPAWEPGVLFVRVRRARPWLSVCDGWPSRPATTNRDSRETDSLEALLDELSRDELAEIVRGDPVLQSLAAISASLEDLRRSVDGRRVFLRVLRSRESLSQTASR